MPDIWWKPSEPGVVSNRPWLHPAVTAYLETLLRPTDVVYEHGSGGSTLWLAERVQRVFTVESDEKWYEVMKPKMPANVEYRLNQSDYLYPVSGLADVILIDGLPLFMRRVWLDNVYKIIKPGGIVVLDNANRPDYVKAAAHLRDIARQSIVFNMNCKISKYLVTEFFLMQGGEREWI